MMAMEEGRAATNGFILFGIFIRSLLALDLSICLIMRTDLLQRIYNLKNDKHQNLISGNALARALGV
jgi:hypothetical protein